MFSRLVMLCLGAIFCVLVCVVAAYVLEGEVRGLLTALWGSMNSSQVFGVVFILFLLIIFSIRDGVVRRLL